MSHYALRRTVTPASEPLTLAEAKLYLKVEHHEEDSLIEGMITAVRQAAEEYLRKSLITQGWTLTYEDYAPSVTPLPRGPVASITHVKIRDRLGNVATVSGNYYHLNAARTALHFNSVVLGNEVEIAYTAGYGGAGDVPQPIRQGMLRHLAALYDNRTGGVSLPSGTTALYAPYCEMRL